MDKKPNVIFILTDDQGYGDLGCTGNPIVQTPNIDKLHDESIRFTNYHVGPTCAPTRAGLMTGLYANSTGVWHTIGGRSLLRREKWTLASAMHENGYRTGIFGKWHLGDMYPYRPMDRGFDDTVVHGGGGVSQTPDYWGNDYFDDTYFVNGEPKQFQGYCTDVFFGEALQFIEENKERPFFCCITPNAPHSPYNVSDQYADPYRDKVNESRARFYGMITNIDENIGKLREQLSLWGIEDNTILIFMTDNGSSCGANLDAMGFVKEGYNGGLRGMKDSEYDGGHRVPFFLYCPKHVLKDRLEGNNINSKRESRNINQITSHIDFMPTILELCNIDIKKGVSIHGKSLLGLIRDTKDFSDRVIVTDSQRLPYPMKWRKSAVMTNRWRLINGVELYDMEKDREQRVDVFFTHQEVVRKLRKEYEIWWDLVSEQFDEEIPILIGDEAVEITSHDMRNETCDVAWNQGQIRKGYKVEGYYEVLVEKEGLYKVSLSRWPKSLHLGIRSGYTDEYAENHAKFYRDGIDKNYLHYYEGGEAINILAGNLTIQDEVKSVKITEEDVFAEFCIKLYEGNAKLKAWFSDEEGSCITSAYYIYIEKIEEK